MRTGLLLKIICIGIVLFFTLVSGCTKKKSTSPTESVVYLMKDYFPLNLHDHWTWEVTGDTITEMFIDGDVNLGEPFIDANKNGIYDFGEQYADDNFNGKYDGPNDPWTPGVPYEDRNHNYEYDPPDGMWEKGETFTDLDGNGVCNKANNLTLYASIRFLGDNDVMYRQGQYEWIQYGTLPPHMEWTFAPCEDAFSNDTLGLRWHKHDDKPGWNDYLKDLTPITIAKASTKIGDTVSYADTSSPNYIWISIFEMVDDVTVPARTFQNCLKFKTIASGWIGNMAKYNGTSYQWYAKNVGLVKSEGPKAEEHWRLKSAEINGKSYP